MYYHYFGLKEAPFSIAVNPRYLFMSARHRDALAHLLYGVGEGGGFILLTGEVGTGKTTIIRSLLDQLPENTDIALVFNPALDAKELLASVCDELGVAYLQDHHSMKNLTDSLHRFLLENHAEGRHTVLLIDEAQHLKLEVLEQIRLLTNLETNTKKLLQIILVGQPELRTLLNKPELRQLAQRITARYQLKPLNLQETDDYIRHRLQVAGLPASQVLFPRSVVKAIHRSTRGVPRIINVLCDRMLLGTYGQNKTVVDKAMFKQALGEVVGEEEDLAVAGPGHTRFTTAAAMLCGLLLVGLAFWQYATNNTAVSAQTTTTEATTKTAQKAAPVVSPVVNPVVSPVVDPADIPAVATALQDLQTPDLWFDTQPNAIAELLAAIGAKQQTIDCDSRELTLLRCERITVSSWQELQSYNRPAVLTLITKAKMQRYVTVMGFNQDHAFIQHSGEIFSTPITELGELWTGDALFIWQAHEHYIGPIALNDRGPAVAWVAQQFASLDQQSVALANTRFNEALKQRVIIFQQAHQLQADGVVGLKTLLKLNEQLASPVTLITAKPSEGSTISGAITSDNNSSVTNSASNTNVQGADHVTDS